MRTARSQTNDLGRTEHFFGALLSGEEIKEAEKNLPAEPVKPAQANGSASISFKLDAKPRFSDPPAPPPQQPLPEKPDSNRSHSFDPSSPSLKRSTTERPRSGPAVSPTGKEASSQIGSLVEALSQAKKEIDAQSLRVRDLEEMLKKEREARETAEEHAKRLQLESANAKLVEVTEVPEEKIILVQKRSKPPL
jgi:phosphatidylserine/phosphatidylglycerophosphate/cardiolipin synthase-like enzyme